MLEVSPQQPQDRITARPRWWGVSRGFLCSPRRPGSSVLCPCLPSVCVTITYDLDVYLPIICPLPACPTPPHACQPSLAGLAPPPHFHGGSSLPRQWEPAALRHNVLTHLASPRTHARWLRICSPIPR